MTNWKVDICVVVLAFVCTLGMIMPTCTVSAYAPTHRKNETNTSLQRTSTEMRCRINQRKAKRHPKLVDMPVYSVTSRKPWMDYRAITDPYSSQWRITRNSTVGYDGLLRYKGYICVAMGQRYGRSGDRFIITIGGKDVKCIIADSKRYQDTAGGAGWTDKYGNVLEVIVHSGVISSQCRAHGSMDYTDALHGRVTRIRKLA